MNCVHCWKEVPEGSTHCPDCGAPIDSQRKNKAREGAARSERRPRSAIRRINLLIIAAILVVAATFGFGFLPVPPDAPFDAVTIVPPPTDSKREAGPDAFTADTGSAVRAPSGPSPLGRLTSATVPSESATSSTTILAPGLAIDSFVRLPTVRPQLSSAGATPREVRTTAAVRVGGDVKMPVKTRDVRPAYPRIARAIRVEGDVVLEAVISTEGRVTDVRVVESVRLLDQAALDSVWQWQYEPARLNGVAVPVAATITVKFSL